jgi:hypothetical protein
VRTSIAPGISGEDVSKIRAASSGTYARTDDCGNRSRDSPRVATLATSISFWSSVQDLESIPASAAMAAARSRVIEVLDAPQRVVIIEDDQAPHVADGTPRLMVRRGCDSRAFLTLVSRLFPG